MVLEEGHSVGGRTCCAGNGRARPDHVAWDTRENKWRERGRWCLKEKTGRRETLVGRL